MPDAKGVQRPRGKPFHRGQQRHPASGRAKGTPNVTTRAAKEMVAECAAMLGGVARLVAWAKESDRHETLFWVSIWPRLMPLQLQGGVDLNVKIDRDELLAKLTERGLPPNVFGCDKPNVKLLLEPPRAEPAPADDWSANVPATVSNGNGQDHA
jgi:hypothetical protein